jgi:chromosome segregation ATPase
MLNDIEQREAQLESQFNQLGQSRDELASAQEHLKARREKFQAAEKQLAEQQQAIDQSRTELDQRAQAQDQREKQLAEREQQLEARRGELEQLESDLVAKAGELDELDESLTARQQELAQRAEQLAAEQAALDARRQSLETDELAKADQAEAELVRQRQELDHQRQALKREQTEALENSRQQLDAKQKELEAFYDQLHQEQAAKLEADRAALQDRSAQLEKQQAELAQQQDVLAQREAELDQRAQALDKQPESAPAPAEAEHGHAADEQTAQQLQAARAELDQLRQELADRQQQLDQAKAQIAEQQQLLEAASSPDSSNSASSGDSAAGQSASQLEAENKKQRKKLHMYKDLLDRKAAKLQQRIERVETVRNAARQVLNRRSELEDVASLLEATEQQMIRRWGVHKAASSVLMLVVGVGLAAGLAWFISDKLASRTWAASASLTQQLSGAINPETWVRQQQQLFSSDAIIRQTSTALQRAGYAGRHDAEYLAQHFADNLNLSIPDAGEIHLELRGSNREALVPVLNGLVSAYMTHQRQMGLQKREAQVIAPVVVTRKASLHDAPIEDDQMQLAGTFFGIGCGFAAVLFLLHAVVSISLARRRGVVDQVAAPIRQERRWQAMVDQLETSDLTEPPAQSAPKAAHTPEDQAPDSDPPPRDVFQNL